MSSIGFIRNSSSFIQVAKFSPSTSSSIRSPSSSSFLFRHFSYSNPSADSPKTNLRRSTSSGSQRDQADVAKGNAANPKGIKPQQDVTSETVVEGGEKPNAGPDALKKADKEKATTSKRK